MFDSLQPYGLLPIRLSFHGIFQARILEWLPFPSLGDLPDPGMEPSSPVSPALQVDSLSLSSQGSPKSTHH